MEQSNLLFRTAPPAALAVMEAVESPRTRPRLATDNLLYKSLPGYVRPSSAVRLRDMPQAGSQRAGTAGHPRAPQLPQASPRDSP